MIRTIQMPMPITIRGFTQQDIDGDYNIVINENLSEEQKARTYLHELRHIKKEDFLKDEKAIEIERANETR